MAERAKIFERTTVDERAIGGKRTTSGERARDQERARRRERAILLERTRESERARIEESTTVDERAIVLERTNPYERAMSGERTDRVERAIAIESTKIDERAMSDENAMNQRQLFDPDRLARPSDPTTSMEAAEEVVDSGLVSTQAALVAELVRKTPGKTGHELAEIHGADYHMLMRRLGHAAGVDRGGARECSVTGRRALTWWPRVRRI
jgi:hypothetical protein